MKTKVMMLAILVMMGAGTVLAQNKSEKFKVKGNCGMCEKRIEKAAKSVEGVTLADWDKKTKMMALSFDESKTNVDKVQQAIAKVGHDTPKHKASDEVYNELPGCCQYDRNEKAAEKHDHKHDH
ncbi:cation transporter [uncultured Sunxiuqinia sp.]|uniref:heavy-metal-associated domain-containing protein n=1 Tax=uncultured Sunxiuqinia sp. TaxID=1573825 RepID=UPI002635F57D|nr:cation transporter [uncultured Sunxiuqinia sp.]